MKPLLSGLAASLTIVVTGVTAGLAAAADHHGGDATITTTTSVVRNQDQLDHRRPHQQLVLPGHVLIARQAAGGTKPVNRTDRRFLQVSTSGSDAIPSAAMRAYHRAAATMGSCHISWTMLAAIGRVESDHGRYGGATLSSDGISRPEIIGPALGGGKFAAIRDTDMGTLDGDPLWDHAVGQMQFIPSTWRTWGRDGDHDGVINPNDIDDSAMAAAAYLCAAGGNDLSTTTGMARAAFAYNHSDYYVALVLAFERGYRTGVFVLPSPPAPPGAGDTGAPGPPVKLTPKQIAELKALATAAKAAKQAKAQQAAQQEGHQAGQQAGQQAAQGQSGASGVPLGAPAGSGTGSGGTSGGGTAGTSGSSGGSGSSGTGGGTSGGSSGGSSGTDPSPAPSPTEAPKTSVTGTWTSCNGGYCLSGTQLDLSNYHGALPAEGSTVTASVDKSSTPWKVYAIG